ncbi:MAG: chemotaxis protein CheB [Desulfobacteraceae bacterium]
MVTKKKEIQHRKSRKVLSEKDGTMESESVTGTAVSDDHFPIVGIGASAGGLKAFEDFFSGMPDHTEPGMAFVLVQHLAPDHKSILTELVRRYTRMQVFEVADGMVVRPNCAYIIPPNRDMALLNGSLQLLEPASDRGPRLSIDFFFRSLAQDQRERAIGIVLSGTGSDGSMGIRAIKGEGGMVMAQKPDSTEYDGMPRSAIDTGLVDYQLNPSEMPAQLIAYATKAFSKKGFPNPPALSTENSMQKVFILLRTQTGHDFSQYKPSTIQRRIERRMAVHQIETMAGYVKYMQQTLPEVELLFRDLLIGVTFFFRDPNAFKALEEKIILKLCSGKSVGSAIRVWVTGCSTGEEAYSIAILIKERMEELKRNNPVQIFATDIDSQAIATARSGIYPASIVADITPERLARYFVPEQDGGMYRIHKNIRDMLIFSEQDVVKDPPFSKIDLISCRNLLIYLNGDLQKKIIRMFHYALTPGGYLFLGNSETVGEFNDLFDVQDRKLKLYQRKEDTLKETTHGGYRVRSDRYVPFVAGMDLPLPQTPVKTVGLAQPPLRELTEQGLLQHFEAVGVLVNGKGDILYLHGRTGMYLEPAQGVAGINNILSMARAGLRMKLTTALQQAVNTNEIASSLGLRVKTNGHYTTANLIIRPVMPGSGVTKETHLYLVVLEEVRHAATEKSNLNDHSDHEADPDLKNLSVPDSDTDSYITALKQELRTKDEYLKTTTEQLETSNEELKSSNEEMQSVNEELQSTNEELETSKEELQSVNEELSTVNAELQTKVMDLTQANNDMNNLLAGTGIGTVFVDYSLHILRFTPTATRIINLIKSDVGRPVGHIVSNLVGYDRLVADTKDVLSTLIPKEVEVQSTSGVWYTMRIMPYRTLDNVIEGAVMTFVEITRRKQIEEELKRSETLLKITQRLTHVGAWEWDVMRKTLYWTEEMFRLHDRNPKESLSGMTGMEDTLKWLSPADRPVLEAAFNQCVETGKSFDLQFPFTTSKGKSIRIRTMAEPVFESGKITRVVGFILDITNPNCETN